MGKLNQVIAVVASKKAKAAQTITEAYHKIQKPTLFEGILKTYQPKDEEGDKLPSESKHLQVRVGELVSEVKNALTEMFNVVATQDFANCVAISDIVVNGKTILTGIPVTHLLFLEKQTKDIETFISKIPTLDPADVWNYNESLDQYATTPTETARTKKVPKAFVKYEATKEHPAQVETFQEDILVGYWKTTKFSGAVSAKQKNEWLNNIRLLHEAIIKARENANSIEASPREVGDQIFDFVFG